MWKTEKYHREKDKDKETFFFPSHILHYFDEALSLKTEKSVFSYIKKQAENVALAH